MPRGHLDERYVQKTAVEWLVTHYKLTLGPKAILPTIERYVGNNSQYGIGGPDGLVAALLKDNSIFVASLKAKSSRTWKDILETNPVFELTIELLFIGSAWSVIGSILGNILGFHGSTFAVLSFIISIVIYGSYLIKRKRDEYRRVSVVHQLKRYPADEQWIALSTDIYNRVKREKFPDNFLQTCERDGIGLLQVSPSQKVTRITDAKRQTLPKGLDGFLSCYSEEAFIRKGLQTMYEENIVIGEPIEIDLISTSEIAIETTKTQQAANLN